MVKGRPVNFQEDEISKNEALEQYNDFILARELHFSYTELQTMPRNVYNNFIVLLNLTNQESQNKIKK